MRTPAKGPKARKTRHPGGLDHCRHLVITAFFLIAHKSLFNNSSIILLRISNLFFSFQNSPSRISLLENVDICCIVSSLNYIKGIQFHLHNTSDFQNTMCPGPELIKMLRILLLFQFIINELITNQKNFPPRISSFLLFPSCS